MAYVKDSLTRDFYFEMRRIERTALSKKTERKTCGQLETAVRRVQERLANLPILDARDPDDLIGYDEHGVTR